VVVAVVVKEVETEVKQFLTLIGPIAPLEWSVVANWHWEIFVARNHDVTLLQHKFNSMANMVPLTGDPNIPPYIQLAKDVMWAIKIWINSGDVGDGYLGIEGVTEFQDDNNWGLSLS
jgi:hypothetical protein